MSKRSFEMEMRPRRTNKIQGKGSPNLSWESEFEDDYVPSSSESSWRNSQVGLESDESFIDDFDSDMDGDPEIFEDTRLAIKSQENCVTEDDTNDLWMHEFNTDLACVERIPEIQDSDFDDSELEEALFGLPRLPQTSVSRKRRSRKKRALPYTSKKGKAKRRSAATPSKMSEKAEKLLEAANEAYLKEEYDEAIILTKQVVAEAPQAHEPLHLLGLIYETVKSDLRKALGYYFVAASYVKSDLAAWKQVGRLAQSISDEDVAIYCYRKVVPPTKWDKNLDQEACYELARLFLKRLDFKRAALYLQKVLQFHAGDSYLTLELAKCHYNLKDYQSSISVLEEGLAVYFPDPQSIFPHLTKRTSSHNQEKDIDHLTWQILDMLSGLYLEGKQFEPCVRTCNAMIQRFLGDGDSDVLGKLHQVSPELQIRYAASHICLRSSLADQACTIAINSIKDKTSGETRLTLYSAIADAYLEVSEPQKALTIYSAADFETGSFEMKLQTRNAEFYIKIARCYLQMKEFEKAATFLESVIPQRCTKESQKIVSAGDVVTRVREVEARLLLFRVLSQLDGHPDADRLDICDDPTRLAARDNRISSLEIGSSIATVPSPVGVHDRQLIMLRLRRGLDQMKTADFECHLEIPSWLKEKKVGSLPRPRVNNATVNTLLSGHYSDLFKCMVNDQGDDNLTELEVYEALTSQPVSEVPLHLKVCPRCDSVQCSLYVNEFLRFQRKCWTSEFLLVVRDSLLDTRRVLSESSRLRAIELSRHLAKSRGFLGEQATSFVELPRESEMDIEDDDNDERIEQRFSNFERRFVVRVRSKIADTELRRRRELHLRGGLTSKAASHLQLRAALGLASLEDLLGWEDFGLLLLEGARILLCEDAGRIAVDLIENTLLNLRFSRVQGPEAYVKQRSLFRTMTRRISLRTALSSQMMRIALSGLRQRYLLPMIRSLMKGPIKNDQETLILTSLQSGLSVYSTILFNLAFAHHSIKSISASSERDVIAFNRAWCTRHLMEFPFSFPLTMMVAHYCLFSMRWPYAVAEYTRAVHLKPNNCVASLCLATCTLSFATSRGVQDRHHVVLRGLALLRRHDRLREHHKQLTLKWLHLFLVQKIESVFRQISELDTQYLQKFHNMYQRLGISCNDDIVTPIARQMAEIRMTLEKWIDTFYVCEAMYNQARAYHHLSLEYLAFPLYTKLLQKLKDLQKELKDSSLGRLYVAMSDTLLVAKQKPASDLAIIEYLKFTDFSPALHCHIQWPHGIRDLEIFDHVATLKDFAEAILFAQLPHRGVEERLSQSKDPLYIVLNPPRPGRHTTDQWLFPKVLRVNSISGTTPSLDTHSLQTRNVIQEIKDGRNHGCHPLEGLFKNANLWLEDKELEYLASDMLLLYQENLPPALFLLGVDCEELRLCCTINLAVLQKRQRERILASEVLRTGMVWS